MCRTEAPEADEPAEADRHGRVADAVGDHDQPNHMQLHDVRLHVTWEIKRGIGGIRTDSYRQRVVKVANESGGQG